jgi:GNAT superfamily N-acetyltransferase
MSNRTDIACDGSVKASAIGAPAAPTWESLRLRLEHANGEDLAQSLRIEAGSIDDYRSLAKFHYRSAHPGVVTSLIRIVHRDESCIDRFLGRGEQAQVIGVLVRSLPPLSCTLRDVAMRGRYTELSPRETAVLLNREVRTISRVVIHPQWRGLGLAVKLVRHALANPEHGIIFTEALAAMGRVCPFFERAGMTRYEHPPRARRHDARLIDALAFAEQGTLAPEFLLRELRRWHGASYRAAASQLRAMPLDKLLRSARSALWSRPAYFAFAHVQNIDSPSKGQHQCR